MIGVTGEVVECWGAVDKEYLRRFTQAVMDPDPRYWDEEFAATTRYGEIIVPPIMVSYMAGRLSPSEGDPVTAAFRENPQSDGIEGVRKQGELPPIPHRPGTDAERRKRTGALQVPQHRRQGVLPEQVLQHHGARGDVTGAPSSSSAGETMFRNQRGESCSASPVPRP